MRSSSPPSLKCKLSCLIDAQQQKKRPSFPGDQVKIQKVPPYLRKRSQFAKYYFPNLVSIGPIHHPKGEEYKEMWAKMYLQDKVGGQQEEAQKLVDNIQSQIQELKKLYNEDVIQGWDDDELTWILFLDGCAALHVMEMIGDQSKLQSSKFQALYMIVQQDLLLLENQLPYQVLRILKEDDSALKNLRNSFLNTLHIVPSQQDATNPFENDLQQHQPAHLLDLLTTSIVAADHITKINVKTEKKKEKTPTHRNVLELVTAGIEIKKSNVKYLTSIELRGHVLHIPPFIVDDFTAQAFMNMMAYEMCPDSKGNYEINNYVCFLNSLIDHADDVKLLRKAGVLVNLLGSDEEVAQIFNTVSADLVLDTGIYSQVRQDIERLYTQTLRTWFSELQRKHFNTPWTIIGLIAFILGLVGTIANLVKELGPKERSPEPPPATPF